jgi:hypothetical protein
MHVKRPQPLKQKGSVGAQQTLLYTNLLSPSGLTNCARVVTDNLTNTMGSAPALITANHLIHKLISATEATHTRCSQRKLSLFIPLDFLLVNKILEIGQVEVRLILPVLLEASLQLKIAQNIQLMIL